MRKSSKKGWTIEKLPTRRISSDSEKETLIRINKAEEKANIWSSDKPTITKLKKKRGVTLLVETKFGAEFEIEKDEIKIGATRRVRKT